MTALTAGTAFFSGRKIALRIVGVIAALGLVAACTDDRGQPTNQTTGTVVGAGLGGLVGGLAFGSVGGVVGGALIGGLAGNLVGRALDDQERRRLAEATQNAFVAENNVPTTYTVEPTKTSSSSSTTAPPTVVSAKPVGSASSRADGSTCRPIELTATKNGQTTSETTTFCKSAGSQELKPVSV